MASRAAVGKDGLFTSVLAAFRKCLGNALRGQPPEPANEVMELLQSLQMTPRQVQSLWRTFLELKQHDPLTLTTGPNEASTSSMVRLVRVKRQWVSKILLLLLDLAGFQDTVTWDGFLYVFLQFCTMSKLELCQTMFYVIARQMKSWTVHYLTSTQLEEFYQDFIDCPVKSFDTGSVDFTKLALVKYHITDFIELLYRFSQLINPMMHLQRSLQQSLPSLKFWSDYDRAKTYNRKVTIDFFRHKKLTTITELVTGVAAAASVANQLMPQKYYGYQLGIPDAESEETNEQRIVKAIHEVKNNIEVADCVHLPLGPPPPPRQQTQVEAAMPVWLKEHLKLNIDPIKGVPLGSAADATTPREEHRPEIAAGALATVEEAKGAILASFGPPLVREKPGHEFVIIKHPRPSSERLEAVARSQDLEFIRKSRRGDAKRDNMVQIMERHCTAPLIDRPVRKVQGHL